MIGAPWMQLLHIHTFNQPQGEMFFECHVVVDMYYVARPMMAASVTNRYRLFSYHYSLKNTIKQLFTEHSHYIRYCK